MIIYISGPMTGVPELNRPAFEAKEVELKSAGHTVLNPHCLPAGMDYEDYMKIDLAMVEVCDAVVLLPGWENSPGALREVKHARDLGKTVEV